MANDYFPANTSLTQRKILSFTHRAENEQVFAPTLATTLLKTGLPLTVNTIQSEVGQN